MESSTQKMADRVRRIPQVGDYLAGAGLAVSVVGALLLLMTPILYYLVPLVLGIVGLPIAMVGMVRARREGHGGSWLGLVGVVVGAIAIGLGVVYAIAFHDTLAAFGA